MTALVLEQTSFPAVDPLAAFAAAGTQSWRCFWSQPSQNLTLVGIGSALSWSPETSEPASRFAQAEEFMAGLSYTGIEPLALGGFAFSPASSSGSASQPCNPWHGFANASLTIPQLLLVFRHAGEPSGHNTASAIQSVTAISAHAGSTEAAQAVEQLRQQLVERLQNSPEQAANYQPAAAPPNSANLNFDPTSSAALWDNFNQQATHSYSQLLDQAISAIEANQLQKVIAARQLASPCALTPEQVLGNLLGRSPANAVFAFGFGPRVFMGATPELLIHKQGDQLNSLALAGSAPPPQADQLLSDPKELTEHEIVATQLRQGLADTGAQLNPAAPPELLQLDTIAHLATRISGTCPGKTALELAGRLHPSPSIAGSPTELALEFIAQYETLDRGWYAGPVGWTRPSGDGEFHVALRSLLLDMTAQAAYCFAGSGIVPGSTAEKENQETLLKLQTALSALA